jgi:uncharacterized membrane protein YfcA
MHYIIVFFIIAIASFLFAMLGLGGGMVYVPVLNWAGFIGGMLGLGGGFIIAPILMATGYKTKQAAATTAFVVTFSSFSGYFGHMAQGKMNWKKYERT